MHHVGPDARQRVVLDDAQARLHHRDAVDVRRILQTLKVEYSRGREIRRGQRIEQRGKTTGSSAEQPEVAHQEEHADAHARADPRVAAEGEAERDDERRHHERGPRPVVLGEHDARDRRARDEHQLPRVRHVQPERALRPPSEVVVLEDAELDDADDGADRADGDDDVDRGKARRPRQQPVADRHDEEQQQLLAVEEADARIDREDRRDERRGRVAASGQNMRGTLDPLVVPRRPAPARARSSERQQDVRGGDRQLQRRHEAEQREARRALERSRQGHRVGIVCQPAGAANRARREVGGSS